MARKRKIEKPKSTGVPKKKAGIPSHTNPKTVSPTTHVKKFVGECLEVQHKKLFSVACRGELSLKKILLKIICSGHKHSEAKANTAYDKEE